MIRDTFRISENGVPILSNREIDRFAEHVIMDFAPELLTKPGPVPIEFLAESYFGLALDYRYLSHDGHLWGVMIFRDNTVQIIYDPQTNLAEERMENRGTILVDIRLTEAGRKEQKRTTIAHEIGHWLFHRIYFVRQSEKSESAVKACDMDSCIERREGSDFQTDRDWMEHQAKFFSGAILMPESAFGKPAVDPQIQKFLFITHARSDVEARNRALAKQLAHVFQVSEKAARLRMKELDISMGPGMSSVEFEQARKKFLEEQEKKKKVSKRRKRGNSCAK